VLDAPCTQCCVEASHAKPGAHWSLVTHDGRHAPKADEHAYSPQSKAPRGAEHIAPWPGQNDGPTRWDASVHVLGAHCSPPRVGAHAPAPSHVATQLFAAPQS
jgi:hypothetical protein